LRGFVFRAVFFVENVVEFRGIEHLSAELTLDKLYVFLAGNDANLGMFAGGRHMGKDCCWSKFAFDRWACQSLAGGIKRSFCATAREAMRAANLACNGPRVDVNYLGPIRSHYRLAESRALMLRLTKKADYGLMALKYLAEQTAPSGQPAAHSAKDIAQAYHIPPPLLAKILQTLARAGLLVSHAGTNGGYALARPATEISAFEVIRAIDGPLFITSCITIHGTCDLAGHCTIKEPLRKVNDSIKELLSGIRISDLAEPAATEIQPEQGAAVGSGLVTIVAV